jgi:TatD DNase family protein
MIFFDSHTHIYSEEFDRDRDEMIRRAAENGVQRLFLPAIDSNYHARMLEVSAAYPQMCRPMMGLHPTSVKDNYEQELGFVEEYLSDTDRKFVAIGEIGIDLYWDRTHETAQRTVFDRQLKLAVKYDLPVVIHTRNSLDIALGMVAEINNPGLRGVFHCFSGNIRQAEKAVALGFMLGIGGVITYKNSGLQAVVEHTGLEHLLLETDAPWLPPVPHRGKRNEPSYLPFIARKIAEIKGVTVGEVARFTTENAGRMFGAES